MGSESDQQSDSEGADVVVRDPLPQRKTRGTRMNDLVGEAAEADEDFWGQNAWKELSDDDNISSEEFDSDEKEDVEDSDFDDLDEDAVQNAEKKAAEDWAVEERKKKRSRAAQPKGAYVDPALKRKRRSPVVRKGTTIQRTIVPSTRTLRRSTKNNTLSSRNVVVKKPKGRVASKTPAPEIPKLTQKQLLEEAAKTEIENRRSLAAMLMISEEKKRNREAKKDKKDEKRIIFKSSREADTLSFTNIIDLPALINSKAAPYPDKKVCAITGKPAKYKDPLTGSYYATVDAFKKLRAKAKR